MRLTPVSFIFIAILLFSCQNRETKKVTAIYNAPLSDTVKTILQKGNSIRETNYQQAVVYYLQAIKLARQQKDNRGLVDAYRNAVFMLGPLMNEYDSAMQISRKSISFAHKMGDANTLCDMYSMQALVYQAKGDLDSAVAVYKTALKYMEEDDAPDEVKNWPLYLNVADLYSMLGNQQIAIEYTNHYLDKYVLKVKDTGRLITAYNNLSVYYARVDETTLANKNIYRCYELLKYQPVHPNADAVYSNLLNMYNIRKMYDSALFFCEKRLGLNKDLKEDVGIARSYSSMMEVAGASQNKILAQRILQERNPFTHLLTDEELPLADKKVLYDGYYRMYKLLGDENNSYFFLQTAYEVAGALRKQEINKELETYELERKKVMQENVILAKQLQLNKKNNTIFGLVIASLLVIMAGVLILLAYKRRLSINKKQIELLEKEKEWNRAKSILEGKLEERNRISRELHDDLGASLTSIVLAGEIIKGKSTVFHEEMNLISTSALSMIDNLNEIVWSLNSRNDSLFGLIAYIRKFAAGFLSKAGIHFEVVEDLPVGDMAVSSGIRRAVYLTAKEAFNNIVKHSGATHVLLSVLVSEKTVTISIEDNGNGLTKESANKGGGNGMKNMQKNMAIAGGSCRLTEDNGVTVIISINIENVK